MASWSRIRWTALAGLVLAACNDPPTAPPPDQLVVTRPSATVGAPGFPLMDTIFVRVLDAAGKPRVGVEVSWVVRDGGGSVLPLWPTSGTDGTAAAIWTLGPRPGYNELRVSISEEASHTFTATGEVFRASEVVGDFYFGCGLVEGAIWCWGRYAPVAGAPSSNYDSASTTPPYFGTYYTSTGPALYDGAREYADLALGWQGRICALDSQGMVWCGPTAGNSPPVPIAGLPPLRQGSLVGSYAGGTCGLSESDGRAWCHKGDSVAVVPGSPAFSAMRLDRSGLLNCGLLVDSTAACWGAAPLGDGSLTPSPTPVAVSGDHRFVDLVVGTRFGCGRTAGGELWCWGRPLSGQFTWLEPTLVATNVTLAGATQDLLLISTLGGGLSRGGGPDFGPADWNPPLEGLGNAAVTVLPKGGISCVVGVDSEVYCVEEMWNGWTGFHFVRYLPVMPVRQAPPAPAVLR